MKKGSKFMGLFIGSLLVLIGMIIIFFSLPNSKTRSDFNLNYNKLIEKTVNYNVVFTEDDIKDLPDAVQKYYRYCGFIGKPKMSYLEQYYNNVTFGMGVGKPNIKIDYKVLNIAIEPTRIAYIGSSMYGIPFEGFDVYLDGKGSMKGVLGKVITLFNQTGPDLDASSLITVLSESLLMPTIALQDYIKWDELDSYNAKATITYYGLSLSGVFTFNEVGEFIKFTTNDRTSIEMDGKITKVPWTIICGNYHESNGIKHPTELKAIWHYESGDYVYFDSSNLKLVYGYEK